MLRVYFSRAINYYVLRGENDEMISSRLHREKRYGWKLTINLWFYWITNEKHHCEKSYRWERSKKGQILNKLDQ